jgi:hypothetical protein
MPNPLYVAAFQSRIKTALAAAKDAAAVDHPGLIGNIREILVGSLLKPILPPNIEIGTGQIVDHTGGASAQIDIVVYDRSVLPPLFYGATNEPGVFPVEACLYAIQVKSTSKATHLDQAIEQGRSLAGLTYLREACGGNGHPVNRVIPAYFAFRSDLAAPSANGGEPPEVARWRSRHLAEDFQFEDKLHGQDWLTWPYPPVRVLCVVDQGYGFYNGSSYVSSATDGDASEVLAFLIGMANSLLQFATRKLTLPFGYYLVGNQADEPPPPTPGSPEDDELLILNLAKRAGTFDANDALAEILNARILQKGPSAAPLANVTEPIRATARLEEKGLIRRINLESPGPHEWEYVPDEEQL